jgi:hypothetical protein
MKFKITVETCDPILSAGLKFYARRSGQTIEEYCVSAIMAALEGDEDATGCNTFRL